MLSREKVESRIAWIESNRIGNNFLEREALETARDLYGENGRWVNGCYLQQERAENAEKNRDEAIAEAEWLRGRVRKLTRLLGEAKVSFDQPEFHVSLIADIEQALAGGEPQG